MTRQQMPCYLSKRQKIWVNPNPTTGKNKPEYLGGDIVFTLFSPGWGFGNSEFHGIYFHPLPLVLTYKEYIYI